MAKILSLFFNTYIYYFKNYYRSRSFYLMLIITLLISLLLSYFSFAYLPKLPSLFKNFSGFFKTPGFSEKLMGYLWAFILLDLPVFASVFFGSPAISSEIETKTAFYIFPLPIPRYLLLFSKYLSAVSVTVIIVIIYIFVQGIVFLLIFNGVLPNAYFLSAGLTILFVFSIVAMTFLISAIFNKNTYAYISVFLIYFLIFNAYTIISEVLYKANPFYLLNNSATIIERVYLNLSSSIVSFSITPNGAGISDIITSVLIMLIYIVVSLGGALILFERKEVK
ncbi:MAG: ABC transporter permease [Thermoplasmataceae archaeon]